MKVSGNALLAKALVRSGIDTIFFIMGGPINDALLAARAAGIRLIDVRHEQAAAMMAQAYARSSGKLAACAGASGPGTINLTTGLANALVDCAPVLALGGSSPLASVNTEAFQEIDQLAIMRPVTKWADRVLHTRRIPEYVDLAVARARYGKAGPVYLDLPGDVLYGEAAEDEVAWPHERRTGRPHADPALVAECVELLRRAERPLLLSGSGVLWSQAAGEMQALVDALGLPFFTTPQGRQAEDHAAFYGAARSTAFREADLVLVAGTRLSWMFGHARAPRFAATAKFVMINIEADEIARTPRADLGLVGDAAAVLGQLRAAAAGKVGPEQYRDWRVKLEATERNKRTEEGEESDETPIHPLRLCRELRQVIDRDTILVVDGQEILNYARRAIPTHVLGNRLNSGPFGTMGVGLPFGVGAKAAHPDRTVIVLHGDGSFGLNAMELDTAVRHQLPVLVVISLNGGWTADPGRKKPGRDLGYTRFDRMADAFGCHGEYVERPEDIRLALERGLAEVHAGRTALVNVVTDWRARADTVRFTAYTT
jgi:thiamine pyrophosphate-dependent acetolactate synthase large subunit-like protein